MRIVSIVGARPQFVKLAMMCREVDRQKKSDSVEHFIVHTGQHYDHEMSGAFFTELGIPAPTVHLNVGSGGHGEQTGEMMKRLEPVLSAQNPDHVLLYGDTNSTLAGATVAAKLGIPAAHIEAGLRSFNRSMPEEINRVVADHLSDLLFCPTQAAMDNLRNEGLLGRAVLSGDIMYDAALYYRHLAEQRSSGSAQFEPKSYALATIHRAENTDNIDRLRALFSAMESIASEICPVVLPLHPRTRKAIEHAGIRPRSIQLVPPASYLEMLLLEKNARFIVTDSGGVQKEAYFAKVPCITVREETEWIETLENGCNRLVGHDSQAILSAARNYEETGPWLTPYGCGNSCELMYRALEGARAIAV